MNNLAQRTLTGIVLVMLTAFSVLFSPYTFILLILAINILGLWEFYRLFHGYTGSPRNISGIILSVSVLVTFTMVVTGVGDWQILFINIVAAFVIFITELYLRSTHPFHNLAFIFLGIICITIPLCFFIALAFLQRNGENYPSLVMGYFIILWLHDSGAYFAGKYFGKRPLFLRLSPKKTWEGSMGGATCAVSAAFILSRYFPVLNWQAWFCMALIIIVTGTTGDLVKSMMKRSLHIKDAGTILPGHGGILDRFDSLLGSAPFVFSYLSITGHV